MMTPDERYKRDPVFRTLVDVLELQIRDAHMSGTEIREAAMLALIHHERTRIPSVRLVLPAIPGHSHALDAHGRLTCGCSFEAVPCPPDAVDRQAPPAGKTDTRDDS